MTDCRKCENRHNCVFSNVRIQEMKDYDNGIIQNDDNGNEINPYKIYDGCEDYKEEE